MKYSGLLTAVIIGLFLAGTTVSGQNKSRQEKKTAKKQEAVEGYENMKKLVHSGLYEFSAIRAFPSGGSMVDLTTNPNRVVVNIYDVESDLPFYGTAYTADLSGEGGIRFKGKLSNIVIEERDRKQLVYVSFDVSHSGGSYKFSFEVFSSGDTRLTVIPSRKSTISYQGRIRPIEDEDEEDEKK